MSQSSACGTGGGKLCGESENQAFFRRIFLNNSWGGDHSRSGRGSEGRFAKQKIEILNAIIGAYSIRTLLDIGCGDFYWMRYIAPKLDRYLGLDIVPEITNANIRAYGTGTVQFRSVDLTSEGREETARSQWDLTLCVDVFGHLTNREVSTLLSYLVDEIKTRYLLVTNRRDLDSCRYLAREKSRHEGIDIEVHSTFIRGDFEKVIQIPALYPNDWFDLYRGRESVTVL
jgi:hypothetical protein